MRLLFVCFGNICRSPSAEAIMNKLVEKAGLSNQITCDSAGTSRHHAGRPADSRMKKQAEEKGYSITSISRSFEVEDFEQCDWIITMDNSNYEDVLSLAKTEKHKKKVLKMADFCKVKDCSFIPDPYYGESRSFAHVISLLEDSCSHLLKHLIQAKDGTS
ncbi:MAG: low molecular weight phosphotyrosine protein phosphatase [Bdellovibrionales bacterium]|nr:low molecular weight phosphotyrosine protein phosphatase [Bdellovibrionales bacterium]